MLLNIFRSIQYLSQQNLAIQGDWGGGGGGISGQRVSRYWLQSEVSISIEIVNVAIKMSKVVLGWGVGYDTLPEVLVLSWGG